MRKILKHVGVVLLVIFGVILAGQLVFGFSHVIAKFAIFVGEKLAGRYFDVNAWMNIVLITVMFGLPILLFGLLAVHAYRQRKGPKDKASK